MNNGDTNQRKSVVSEVLDVLSDHAEILSLEWRYESRQAARRMAAIGVAVVLSLTAFLLLQVALVYGLMVVGLNVGWSSVLLAAIYIIGGAVVWQIFGKRDVRAGRPFEATRRQLSGKQTMDTEAFLLERQRLISELESHRDSALASSAARKKSFLGLPWSDWSHLVFSMGQRSGFTTWLPRILLTAVVPFLLASVERKVESVLHRKSGLSRLLEFLPLSRFGL